MMAIPAGVSFSSLKWALGVGSLAVFLLSQSELTISLAVAALGVFQAVALAWMARQQNKQTEAASTERASIEAEINREASRTDRNDRLIDQLQQQLDVAERLRASDREHIGAQAEQIRRLSIENVRLMVAIERLVAQVESLEHEPVYRHPKPPA